MRPAVSRLPFLLSLMAFAPLLIATESKAPENVSPAFEVQISVLPSTVSGYPLTYRNPPTFNASVLVIEPGTNHVFAGIQGLEVKRGSNTTAVKFFGELDLKFRVGIDDKGEKASAEATVSRSGRVLNRQRSTVWLQQPRASVEPAR